MNAGKQFGICLCGLNGSGKTTLGRELANVLRYRYMDAEEYSFYRTEIPYSAPRPREEIRSLLLTDMQRYPKFVFSAVNGDMGEEITSMYRLVVYLYAPYEVRMNRIRQRMYERLGDCALPGGDLYERERAFLEFVAARTPERIEAWIRTLSCPVLRLDGTASLNVNIEHICSYMNRG